jgi:hypothetical protein
MTRFSLNEAANLSKDCGYDEGIVFSKITNKKLKSYGKQKKRTDSN